jgi:hypothetical protein
MTKMSELMDTFDGSNLDPSKWNSLNGLSTQLMPEGLGFPETNALSGISSIDDYDLTESCLCARVVVPSSGNGFFSISVMEEINVLGFSASLGALTLIQVVGGDPTSTTITYDPVAHRWWRICNVGAYITWETSNNGSVWQTQRREPVQFNLTTLTVVARGGAGSSLDGYGGGVFGVGPYGLDFGYGSKTYGTLTYGGF